MRSAAGVTIAIVLALGATACTATSAPSPSATGSPTGAASASPTATATPAPVLVPSGTATDNLPLFRSVVQTVWAGPDRGAGRAYIDALVAAGFAKTAMQLTPDTSTVGNPAESIEISVRWGVECLLASVGPALGRAVTTVQPGLASGGCLLGTTRPIDW